MLMGTAVAGVCLLHSSVYNFDGTLGCRNLPPGPLWTLPVFGDFSVFAKIGLLEFLLARYRMYGKVFFFDFLGFNVISVISSSDILKLLSSDEDLVEGKQELYSFTFSDPLQSCLQLLRLSTKMSDRGYCIMTSIAQQLCTTASWQRPESYNSRI
jgi:hypothetical protein